MLEVRGGCLIIVCVRDLLGIWERGSDRNPDLTLKSLKRWSLLDIRRVEVLLITSCVVMWKLSWRW